MNIESLVKQKIDEYIYLLESCGYVTDKSTLIRIKEGLNSLKVKSLDKAPGDAVIKRDTLMICYPNIEYNMKLKGSYYLDETLFHEFSHFVNSFHKAIYGKDSFVISDYFENKMHSSIESLVIKDELLYNQDACFGIVLLDEFIAQSMAQNMVEKKYSGFNEFEKGKYVYDFNFSLYRDRTYKSNICEPPMMIETSFAVYQEFDIFAKRFIDKYGYSVSDFIDKALHDDNFVKNLINSVGVDNLEKLYTDLCYLGLIQQRVYLLNGFSTIDDKKDPAYDPEKVRSVMVRILK